MNYKKPQEIQACNDTNTTSNSGSFNCPAVQQIQYLRVELKSLKQLLSNKNPNNSEKLDNSDLMREFKISRGTATTWRNEGLPHIKVGSKIYYQRSEIDLFLQQYKVKGF